MNSVDGNQDTQGNLLVYAGGRKINRKMIWKGAEQSISVSTARLPAQDWKQIRRSITRQWHFTATRGTRKVSYNVRAAMLGDQRCDKGAHKVLVTNRTTWEVNRMLLVKRDRRTGKETSHRDGKQELGMS